MRRSKIRLTPQDISDGISSRVMVPRRHRRANPAVVIGAIVSVLAAVGLVFLGPGAGAFAAAVHQSASHSQAESLGRGAVAGNRVRPAGETRIATGETIRCTDSWKKAESGDWSTAANWSTGAVPTSADNACITVSGTYTVTLAGNEPANTLTLGGSSGAQTLTIGGSSDAADNTLTLSSQGSAINANGVLSLDSTTSTDDAEISAADNPSNLSITNKGTFETLDATYPQADYIGIGLTNDATGTVSIGGANTTVSNDAAITNDGSFTITSAGNLTVASSGQALASFTQSGGTLVNDGTLLTNQAVFTQSGGTDSGNTVQVTDSSSLVDSQGAGSFDLIDNNDLSGTIPAGQTVTVLAATDNSNTTLAANVTNDGTFAVDAESSGGDAAVETADNPANATIINKGTFETLDATTYEDEIDVNVTNDATGTVSIGGANTTVGEGAAITNDGAFTITSAGNLTMADSSDSTSFTQSGGTLVNDGTLLTNDAVFTQSGGTDSGNTVQIFDSSSLVDSKGAGRFDLTGNDNLSGTIPAGQAVTVLADTDDAIAAIAANVTNHGTFTLDAGGQDGGSAVLDGDGTFINDGTFQATGSATNQDLIEADLVNDSGGKVSIAQGNTDQDEVNVTNNGKFTITSAGAWTVTGGSQINATFTQSGGTLANSGKLVLPGDGTFVASGGAETGNPVVLNDTSTLTDSAGPGKYNIESGTVFLSGTIPSGQTVTVLGSKADGEAVADLTGNVTNDGTFVLDSSGGASNYAQVTQDGTPTFTNDGTFDAEGTATAADEIYLPLTNDADGTVNITANTSAALYYDEQGNFDYTIDNSGTFNVGPAATLTFGNDTADIPFNNDGLVNNQGTIALDSSFFNNNSDGTYEATFGGTDPSLLTDISGNPGTVSLAGTLEITTVGSPAAGTVFDVQTGNTVGGEFATVDSGSDNYSIHYDSAAPYTVTATFEGS
jgi:hypothetical protein